MIKKADVVLSAAVAFAAVALLIFNILSYKGGKTAVITVDGELFGRYSLQSDQTVEIKSGLGSNTVSIKNGAVTVEAADCPDGYCVSHVSIGKSGETIVCLPHRLVIEIED